MKKNKMMRLASSLLVAVLLTTSVISGTFAKYVTEDAAEAKARVAKFGVTIAAEGDLFSTTYIEGTNTAGTNGATLSVASVGTDNVVAPGTKGSMTITITGKPEVKTTMEIEFTEKTAISLGAGDYKLNAGEYTNVAKTVTIPTGATYEPVKFYFGTTEPTDDSDYSLTLTGLEEAMEQAFTGTFGNNDTTLARSYYLCWQWAFDGNFEVNGFDESDFLDTYLGKTGTDLEELAFKITVTQVD